MAEILVTEAALHTLSVTIQSLTVSGKQMTLAVFRQLKTGVWHDEYGHLLPISFWGVVRYNIKDEGDLWVVFEKEGELRRGLIPSQFWMYATRPHELDSALSQAQRARFNFGVTGEERERREKERLEAVKKWEALNAEYEELQAEYKAFNKTANASREELLKLPHLFIAV